MRPAVHHLRVPTGDSLDQVVEIREDGDPLNLSGWTVVGELRESPRADVAVPLTVTVLDPSLGRIRVQASAATVAESFGWVWQLRLTDPFGVGGTWVRGDVRP